MCFTRHLCRRSQSGYVRTGIPLEYNLKWNRLLCRHLILARSRLFFHRPELGFNEGFLNCFLNVFRFKDKLFVCAFKQSSKNRLHLFCLLQEKLQRINFQGKRHLNELVKTDSATCISKYYFIRRTRLSFTDLWKNLPSHPSFLSNVMLIYLMRKRDYLFLETMCDCAFWNGLRCLKIQV